MSLKCNGNQRPSQCLLLAGLQSATRTVLPRWMTHTQLTTIPRGQRAACIAKFPGPSPERMIPFRSTVIMLEADEAQLIIAELNRCRYFAAGVISNQRDYTEEQAGEKGPNETVDVLEELSKNISAIIHARRTGLRTNDVTKPRGLTTAIQQRNPLAMEAYSYTVNSIFDQR